VLLKGLSAFPITPADASGQVDSAGLSLDSVRRASTPSACSAVRVLIPTFRVPSDAERWTPP
jgi:hypothetical protein